MILYSVWCQQTRQEKNEQVEVKNQILQKNKTDKEERRREKEIEWDIADKRDIKWRMDGHFQPKTKRKLSLSYQKKEEHDAVVDYTESCLSDWSSRRRIRCGMNNEATSYTTSKEEEKESNGGDSKTIKEILSYFLGQIVTPSLSSFKPLVTIESKCKTWKAGHLRLLFEQSGRLLRRRRSRSIKSLQTVWLRHRCSRRTTRRRRHHIQHTSPSTPPRHLKRIFPV